MYVPMPEGVHLSAKLPEWVRFAIADAVVLFGRMEQETIEIAWLLKDVTLKEKLKLARNPATDTFLSMLENVEQQEQELKLDLLKNGFTALAQERNLIVHGAWTMVEEKPWVVWHKFLQDVDSVIGEFFEASRFERFTVRVSTCLACCGGSTTRWRSRPARRRALFPALEVARPAPSWACRRLAVP